ncbi:hypothetical protein AVE30378_03679 [Achromobacter veterisilvae]|uniref:Uncharacterized protein n=2 Tax=Achromobacter veterisilvae TaxID=2069367 RepID=A0A446CP50_9BURK|nr:hypothetical protein AVE30378_03679 [Achromobacter veterisilvae]
MSHLWPWLSSTMVRLGGPRVAAYLSYLSIDWGRMDKDRTVLCLSRESFVKDVAELRKRSSFNYPMVMGGFTRFQMVWTPASMQIQTFYQRHVADNPRALRQSVAYARHLVRLVSRKRPVNAILSANFDYWQDNGFKQVAKELAIPFLVLSREHPIIPKVCTEVIRWYRESEYRFEGSAIAVAGRSTRDVTMAVGTICRPDQITITGLPRYDAWQDVDTSLPINDRPLITLLTFTEGYYADSTFKEVLQLFCEAAVVHGGAGVEFVIKTKDVGDTVAVHKMMAKMNLHSAARCDHELNLFDVLPKSRLVINYNSLSLVEAVMARANSVSPAWGECMDCGDLVMYPSDRENVSRVLGFARTPGELLAAIAASVQGETPPIPVEFVRAFIDEYIHVPTDGSYCAEFERFLVAYSGPAR